MRVGITLAQFRNEAVPALATAREADATPGVDGVFVFDHLWPLGRPDRPALHSSTLLGALIASTSRVVLGTLVARVGLLPDPVLVQVLCSLHTMAGPDRFIAGLGTGDEGNRDENLAYGIPFAPAAERLASVAWCAGQLRAAGVHTWIGGLSERVMQRAAATADGWNGWGLTVEEFAVRAASLPPGIEATWAGQVLVARTPEALVAKVARHQPGPRAVVGLVDDLAGHLRRLADAGASWAVCAPLDVGTDHEAVQFLAEAAAVGR